LFHRDFLITFRNSRQQNKAFVKAEEELKMGREAVCAGSVLALPVTSRMTFTEVSQNLPSPYVTLGSQIPEKKNAPSAWHRAAPVEDVTVRTRSSCIPSSDYSTPFSLRDHLVSPIYAVGSPRGG
jgi:hypothetical protein